MGGINFEESTVVVYVLRHLTVSLYVSVGNGIFVILTDIAVAAGP